MCPADGPPPPLDPSLAEFFRRGISIGLASCRPGAIASMARGTGCRLDPDLRSVTVLLAATPGAALLDDVRRTGRIAVVFSLPASHQTVQLKGSDARIVPVEADDPERAARYVDAFAAEVSALGYPGETLRALLACEFDDLVAIRFTIDAAFSQTPGPRAGEPLSGGR